MAGAGDAGVGAGAWPDAACSSGFANMVMNLDFLSGLGFAEMVSTGGISADLSLPQLPKRMPCVGSAPEGVCRGAVSMGGAVMEMAVDVSAGTSLDSSFSPAGVSLALICSFQRWKSSCVRGLNSFFSTLVSIHSGSSSPPARLPPLFHSRPLSRSRSRSRSRQPPCTPVLIPSSLSSRRPQRGSLRSRLPRRGATSISGSPSCLSRLRSPLR